MIIDIYDKRVDIGDREDIDSIIWDQSGNNSKLFVTHKDGDISSHQIEHEVYGASNCWHFKGDALQDFLETHGCKALFFDSFFDLGQSGYKQAIRFMNERGVIHYGQYGNIRLITIGGYNLIKDEGYYITYSKLPESLLNSFKEIYDDFQVIYKLNILRVFESDDDCYKVRVFEFDGKCGEIIENKETEIIIINLGRDSVEFNGDLDKVSRVFGEEFASAFIGES